MYRFQNDYSENAHPSILQKLVDMQLEQNGGYGMDDYCLRATKHIKKHLDYENADIHFLAGGTIMNLTVISHVLKPYEAVISAYTGHISQHECGAIEATGHKVVTVDSKDGKLTPKQIAPVLAEHEDEFWVAPKLVYISNPTEIGTVYTKEELENLYSYCKQEGLLLYIDGARLSMALAVPHCNLTMKDLPHLCDFLFIGGTKVGALFGEALAIFHEDYKQNFRHQLKQRGAMLAKGWVLGVQFEQLFQENLYFELGKHANEMAMKIKDGFEKAGCKFLSKSDTNQQFPILPKIWKEKLAQKYVFANWLTISDNEHCVRFCTSWATKEEEVMNLLNDIEQLAKEN